MDEIVFRYNKTIDKPHNAISTVVYRLNTAYKKTSRYYNGIKRLADIVPKFFPNYYLYIFYDDSVVQPKHKDKKINEEIKNHWIPLFEKLDRQPHVRLVNYKHPRFFDGLYHDLNFGTFVRFMPLFSYDVFKNTQNVIVADIDESFRFYQILSKINRRFPQSSSKFHFKTLYCYQVKDRVQLIDKMLSDKYKSHLDIKILGGGLFSKIKFPKNILNDFIKCALDRKKNGCDYVQVFFDTISETSSRKIKKHKDSIFIYGFDEFFLNSALFTHLHKEKIDFSYTPSADIGDPFYNIYVNTNKLKNANDNIKYMFKQLLGKYYDDKKSLQENYDVFDKIVYFGGELNKHKNPQQANKYEYIYNNTKKFIETVKKERIREKYQLTDMDMECLLAHKSPYVEDFVMYMHN